MTRLHTAICAALFSVSATATLAEIDILPVSFTCENNTELSVVYFNDTGGPGAAAMMLDGQLIPMRQVESGSGIRYESVAGEGTYILRSKGWNATISHQGQAATAPERVVLRDCSSH